MHDCQCLIYIFSAYDSCLGYKFPSMFFLFSLFSFHGNDSESCGVQRHYFHWNLLMKAFLSLLVLLSIVCFVILFSKDERKYWVRGSTSCFFLLFLFYPVDNSKHQLQTPGDKTVVDLPLPICREQNNVIVLCFFLFRFLSVKHSIHYQRLFFSFFISKATPPHVWCEAHKPLWFLKLLVLMKSDSRLAPLSCLEASILLSFSRHSKEFLFISSSSCFLIK